MSGEEEVPAVVEEPKSSADDMELKDETKEQIDQIVQDITDKEPEASEAASDLFDTLLNTESEPAAPDEEARLALEKERLMDNVEETMRALQADDEPPSDILQEVDNNDPTEFVQVTNNKNGSEPMEICEDPIGGNNQLDQQEDEESEDEVVPAEEPVPVVIEEPPAPVKESEESIIPDTDREITQEEKDAATSAIKSNGEDETVNLIEDSSSNSSSDFNPNALTNLVEPVKNMCTNCRTENSDCHFKYGGKEELYFCTADCYKQFFKIPTVTDENLGTDKIAEKTESHKFKVSRDKNAIREPLVYVRKCSECNTEVGNEERNLTWECMEFCNEDCIAKFQTNIGSKCANCKDCVPLPSLGKYCVRFGYDIRQFCSSSCLEDFKKGLKVCSYCQKDISGGVEGFLAPVGDKGQFKDFCTQSCMEKYDRMSNSNAPKKQTAQCAVCSNEKMIRLEIEVEGVDHKLCSEPCFVAFKFANNVSPEQCKMCQKYFEQTTLDYTIYCDDSPQHFCCKTCQNVYIIANRKIVPCQWCKVKKYNFDMIKKNVLNKSLMMCSINCLALYQVAVNAVSIRKTKCDHCNVMNQAQYHLTMSDATIRNFCSYQCVMNFQNQFAKSPITIVNTPISAAAVNEKTRSDRVAVPTSQPKRSYNTAARNTRNAEPKSRNKASNQNQLPIITSVHSLAPETPPPTKSQTNGPTRSTASKSSKPPPLTPVSSSKNQKQPPPLQPISTPSVVSQQVQTDRSESPPPQTKSKIVQQFLVRPASVPDMKNKSTLCKPNTHTKGISFKPHMTTKETQTDESLAKTVIIPVPVPIYVPTPMSLYSMPFPVPVPFPLPVPIPIFIPTTRNSAAGIMKEIKKIQVKIPTDPFEAELLMMAEMVAGDKKVENTDSESDDDDHGGGNDGGFSPEAVDTSNTFGDDMLQIALKMATELDEPAVDLEGALTANTITASQSQDTHHDDDDDNQQMHHHAMMEGRGGGRGSRKRQGGRTPRGSSGKRGRRMSGHDMPMMPPPQAAVPPPPPEPVEKPDANMCLKYTFGVNAWKQWVTTKNAELEKSTLPLKPFKSEILQLTADELNYSLCLFVKEVRKPNGSEYAPDTIYYLCLGIQQYLFENGRIDNIFTDAFYEKFTECLDEVARKFSVLYNDSHYIVTRVEEEHLWESKQLGAHSPHVLLSTLMFFNTKHFNLTTVDEHMQLSFSHIMKHWKRNPNQPGASKGPGSRNVLLRFYPPQSSQLVGDAAEAASRKKKVYEQQENEENPLRCPVKLYEFYLSKCPESVKTRNDVFYLLPERSCVPDSPVWYSTMALGRTALEKMLHRVKMVKEINVALLTS